MKKIFSVEKTSGTIDIALLVARLGIAFLMLTHGIPKLMMLLSGGQVQFPGMLGMSPEFSLSLAVFAEVFCSALILTGFATRLATLPLIATMLTAVLLVHASDPFAVKESGLNYLVVYIVLLFAGSGKFSVDYLVSQNRKHHPTGELAYSKR
ncbi:DoxX family protein [Daejeonella lutea]|uniref:Putative oxidoreductase n=1 Tax=Daejeonella lutea TaxID=572036 RepID=A0A1T5A4G9_9SPHI|nr:DoxX family protein [Daejeonella lutea]SKB29617.1 putative oxidoreductase [Daejeonella lutea]